MADIRMMDPTEQPHGHLARRLLAGGLAMGVGVAGFLIARPILLPEPRPASTDPGTSGPIVFAAKGLNTAISDHNIDLWGIDPFAEEPSPVNLSSSPGTESGQVWSPDGTWVAFRREETAPEGTSFVSSSGLYVSQLDGTGMLRLAACGPDSFCASNLTWSADSTKLAWSGSGGIFAATIPSGDITAICKKKQCGQLTADLAWSPDATRLAWAESGPAHGLVLLPSGIYVGDANGAGASALTPTPPCSDCAFDHRPVWSPDGGRLGFDRIDQSVPSDDPSAPGTEARFIMKSDGSGLRSIGRCTPKCPRYPWQEESFSAVAVEDEPVIEVRAPGSPPRRIRVCPDDCVLPGLIEISPDETWLAFLGWSEESQHRPFIMRADGKGLRELPIELACETVPCMRWLPASDAWLRAAEAPPQMQAPGQPRRATEPEAGSIVFAADPTEGNEEYEIYSVPAGGGDPFQLTQTPEYYSSNYPALSADGKSVYFERDQYLGGEEGPQLWAMSIDGTHSRPLPAGDRGSVSPDGSLIAFSRDPGRDPGGIWVMSVDGSGARQLTRTAQGEQHWYPVWSPDGRQLVYEAVLAQGHDLRVIDLEGATHSTVTRLPGIESEVAWAPNGSMIAFRWAKTSGADIYTVRLDGSDLRRLTTFGAGSPSWSPDGRAIAFVAGPLFPEGRGGIYTMRLDTGAVFPVLDWKLGAWELAWSSAESIPPN